MPPLRRGGLRGQEKLLLLRQGLQLCDVEDDRFFEQRKKAFTKAIAAALLKDGKVKIKGMYSTKTGKTFDGVVLLADTGGKYVNFRVEQNRK